MLLLELLHCLYTGSSNNATPDNLWLQFAKERLMRSGESEAEEIGPSCSLQDSGCFLCLNRKWTKSDFSDFHLHAHRTENSVPSISWPSCILREYTLFMIVRLSLSVSHLIHTHTHTLTVRRTPPQLKFLHLPNFL